MSRFFTKDIAALDVGSKMLTAMVGGRRAQSVLGISSMVERMHSGFHDGEWLDAAETVRTAEAVLEEAVASCGSAVNALYIGVPAEYLAVTAKKVGITLDRERRVIDADIDYLIEKGKRFASGTHLVIGSSPVYYSVNTSDKVFTDVRGMRASAVEGYISYVLCERTFTDLFDEVAAARGFKEIRYVASPWAQGITLLEKEQRDMPYVLIDIGYISSSVLIGRGEGILDLKSFSLGGGHIAADMYEALDIPFELAEKAKDLVDINLNYVPEAVLVADGDSVVHAADACELVKSEIEVFADVIGEILRVCAPDIPEYAPFYLTGEGIASMRGARKFLSEILGKSIETIAPKMPRYNKPEDSSKIALLSVADTLAKTNAGDTIKRIFQRR